MSSEPKPVPKGTFTPGPGAPFLHPAPFAVGDRLWVRETWSHSGVGVWSISDARMAGRGRVIYRADCDDRVAGWFPSIFMPREFSRITLTVTEIRCQRLQEISEEDARAEGIEIYRLMGAQGWIDYGDKPGAMTRRYFSDPRASFRSLWDSLNGSRPGCAWDANPWVFAYSFAVSAGNIDKIARSA